MAQRASFLDFASWSSRTWTISVIAGIVALILFLLFGAGFFWALVIGIVVFLAVAWFLQRDAVVPTAPAAYAPPPAPPPPAAPRSVVAPEPVAAAERVAEPIAAPAPADPVPFVEPLAKAAGSSAADLAAVAESVPTRPMTLAAPRDGGPDKLMRLKGIGPKFEEVLYGLGYYHYDQIAGWSEADVAWVESNIDGFTGRVTRDDWVGQARILAAGGETEHSQRVDRGEST